MKNFYHLIQGDCLEVLPTIEDESIDLIITDPPYGVSKTKWDLLNLEWIDEAFRILKKWGSFYVFGSVWWYPKIHLRAIKAGFAPKNVLCWYYGNAMSRQTKNYQMEYDPIGFFVKNEKYIFNVDVLRIPYKSQERIKYKIIKNGKVWKANPLGKKRSNVLNIPALCGKRFENERINHPTQKPEKLIEIMIKASSNKNNLILDPFLGSGTTMKACQNLQRNCIGIEISLEYCNLIKKRCFSTKPLLDEVEYKFEVFNKNEKKDI